MAEGLGHTLQQAHCRCLELAVTIMKKIKAFLGIKAQLRNGDFSNFHQLSIEAPLFSIQNRDKIIFFLHTVVRGSETGWLSSVYWKKHLKCH